MSLVKSLLLGSAAGFAAVSAAQAADLPTKKAAPVEYVRVCSTYGTGFFFIPGTDTCLRVGGRVRAEYRYNEQFSRTSDNTGFRARGRLNVDARTPTPYGTLRAFFRYEITANSGPYVGSATPAGGTVGADHAIVDKAFIQFAGITAGRAQSFFDFYGNELNFQDLRSSERLATNLLAYTASFGGGFSATLSLEDRANRATNSTSAGSVVTYAGQGMPDVVGVLRLDQSWGSAQLSGALREIRVTNRVPAGNPGAGTYADTEYGFALQAGVKINLPMLARGDQLWLQAAYADGALSYVGDGTVGFFAGGNVTRGYATVANSDAYVDAFGGIKKTKAFSITAAFLHYWTPQVRQAIFGSYMMVDAPAAVTSPINVLTGARASGAIVDFNELRLGTNVIWSPVSNFDIGVEVFYVRLDPKGRLATNAGKSGIGTVGADDSWEARLASNAISNL